jgi:hypothetical protein
MLQNLPRLTPILVLRKGLAQNYNRRAKLGKHSLDNIPVRNWLSCKDYDEPLGENLEEGIEMADGIALLGKEVRGHHPLAMNPLIKDWGKNDENAEVYNVAETNWRRDVWDVSPCPPLVVNCQF